MKLLPPFRPVLLHWLEKEGLRTAVQYYSTLVQWGHEATVKAESALLL